jgi:hypothetical protein
MAKWRHASSSTSRGAEAKYQRSAVGQLATDFGMEVVAPSAILNTTLHTLTIALDCASPAEVGTKKPLTMKEDLGGEYGEMRHGH